MTTSESPKRSFSDKLEMALDFTNWREHPSNTDFRVFFFHNSDQADFFENMLQERNMTFERHDEQEPDKMRYFFAVHKNHWQEVATLNNIAIGKYRKRFIPDKIFQWVIFVIAAVVMGLAIVGWLVS